MQRCKGSITRSESASVLVRVRASPVHETGGPCPPERFPLLLSHERFCKFFDSLTAAAENCRGCQRVDKVLSPRCVRFFKH